MTIPKQLYEIEEGEVQLSDAVSTDFEVLSQDQGEMLDDEEWTLLLDETSQETPVNEQGTSRRKREGQQNQTNQAHKERRRKKK